MTENTLFLDESDLSLYFENLPKDLKLRVKNSSDASTDSFKEYLVNKQIISTFSQVLNQKIQEMDENSNTIEIEIDDEQNLMPLVIDFLHGKKINIFCENDFYLDKIAQKLEIQPLIEAVADSLKEELSPSNIIPRILQHYNEKDPKIFDYLYQNIDSIQINEKFFTLPKDLIVDISQNPKSHFKNESSRYLFKLKCCAHYADETGLFMSENDYLELPFDVIYDFLTNNEFKVLDGKIPTLLIVQNLMNKISDNKSQIITLQSDIAVIDEEIEKLGKSKEREQKVECETDSRFIDLQNKITEFRKQIANISNSIKETSETVNLFRIKDDELDELSSKILMLQSLSNEMTHLVNVFKRTYYLPTFTNLTDMILKIPKQWQEKMKPLLQIVGELTSNEAEVDSVINSLHELDQLLVQLLQSSVSLMGQGNKN